MTEDLDLGEADSEEQLDFPPPERKIVTQPYDLSIQTLVEQWGDESLVLPEIQREYVWDNPRASKLIESLLLNIPIPVLYFAETADAKWEIFDGHQRIRSIVRFVTNEFALSSLSILSTLNRQRYHQLPERERRFLERRTIRAVVISNDSHPNMKFETFERLNTGAVVLNTQEIRNSLYRGSFNILIRHLAKNAAFRTTLGTRSPRKRMVDEELILRFFALRQGIVTYRPPLKRFLNTYMASVKDASAREGDALERLFVSTVGRVADVFGSSAFRVIDRRGRQLEKNANRALFEAQMLAFSWVDPEFDITPAKQALVSSFGDLCRDKDFLDAIRLATGDRARTLTRVRLVVEALEANGVPVDPPSLV